MKRLLWIAACSSILLLSGCANLKSVRDFAAETKKVGVAYEPIVKSAEVVCIRNASIKDENEIEWAASNFDPNTVQASAKKACAPELQALKGTQTIADVLKAFADALSELAGDGVAARLSDDYDSVVAQIVKVPGVPAEKASAIGALVKFLTEVAIAKIQVASIEDALSHEDAVGTLGDALVFNANRYYLSGISKDLIGKMDAIVTDAKTAKIPPLLARMQMSQVAAERAKFVEQQAAVEQLRKAVSQMKLTMADVRANFRRVDDKTRLESIIKYKQDVDALYKTLVKAF